MIVVIGHPRSGTGYMASLLQQAGLDVGHERLGKDGISSWMWAVKADAVPWGDARGQRSLRGDTVLHVVREPISCIASIVHTEGPSEPWRRAWVSIPAEADAVERAVLSLDAWQGLCQAQAMRAVAVEDAEAAVSELTGVAVRPMRAPKARNVRGHPGMTLPGVRQRLSDRGLRALGRCRGRWLKSRAR